MISKKQLDYEHASNDLLEVARTSMNNAEIMRGHILLAIIAGWIAISKGLPDIHLGLGSLISATIALCLNQLGMGMMGYSSKVASDVFSSLAKGKALTVREKWVAGRSLSTYQFCDPIDTLTDALLLAALVLILMDLIAK